MSDNSNTKDIVLEADKRQTNLASFLLKKNQRLTSALYMVTGYLSDQDPLKWKLRSVSLEIVSSLNHLSQMSVSEKGQTSVYGQADLGQTLSLVKEILSLMEVALASGSVSQMNFAILETEYRKIKKLLETSAGSDFWGDYLLSAETETQTARLASAVQSNHNQTPVSYKGQESVKDIKDTNPYNTRPAPTNNKASAVKKISKGQNNSRQETIKSFLAGKDWVSIKDIASNLPDYSAKTVQRELADMVASGVLKKKGDRRWSRYSLSYN